MIRHLIRIAILTTGLAGIPHLRASDETDTLRLIATVNQEDLVQFAVEHNEIVARDGGAKRPVPRDATWRLAGSLRAHSDAVLFAPEYEIVNRLSVAEADPAAVLRHAIIRPRRHACWTDDELAGGLVVFVWIVDRKPAVVVPVPAFNRKGPASDFAALATIPLTTETARGAPAVLLWKEGRFMPPRPWFKDAAANQALAAMHLAWPDEQRTSMGALPSPNLRAETRDKPGEARSAIRMIAATTQGEIAPLQKVAPPPSLLYFAAEGGFTEAVALLLEMGARMDEDPELRGPIHAAAGNGRYEAVRLLLTRFASVAERPQWSLPPIGSALSNGHAAAASALLTGASDPALPHLARMAVVLTDAAAIREIMNHGAGSAINSVPAGLLARCVQRGEGPVVALLLESGWPATTSVGGTPLIVVAAASGDLVTVTSLLKSGASVDSRAAGGISPLMTAATLGKTTVAQALLAAGADASASDDHGRTASHYAVLAARTEVLSVLLSHPRASHAADKQGQTPLHLALAMQSRPMVELLVNHGAKLGPKDVANPDVMRQVLAVDAVALLTQAAELGWNPNTKFHDRWPAAQVASIYGADRCSTWLQARTGGAPSAAVPIEKGDTPAAATAGENPAERRSADETYPADSVRVAGVVSATGEFLFPHIAENQDGRTGAAVLDATATWRFRPATKQGVAVASRVALVIPFPGRDPRVQSPDAVATAAAATSLVAAKTESFSTRTDNELNSVTRPTFTVNLSGGQMVDRTEMQLYPEYTVITPTNHWAAATLVVEPDGKPTAIQVVDAVSTSYAASVEEALSQSKFTAGTVNGKAVRTRLTVVYPPDGS